MVREIDCCRKRTTWVEQIGLNRALCALDRRIIWCHFTLISFSDVVYLLGRRGWALCAKKEGDPFVESSPFLSHLSNSTPALNFKHFFHRDLPCACNDQALLSVLGLLLWTAPGPCPQGGYILSHLTNKILQVLLLRRQFVDCYHWSTFLWGLRSHPQEFFKENIVHLNHVLWEV